jgi:tetratricopeptide (TPR) repeat protein
VAYGYFDMLARYIVETGAWDRVATMPLVASSREFQAMQAQVQGMAAASRGDTAAAQASARTIGALAAQTGRHPFAQQIIAIQAREAEALAALVAGDTASALAHMSQATTIEDSIAAPSQPPYPVIPAHELFGMLLLHIDRPVEARAQFEEALKRTPGRPKAIYGIARAAERMGDRETATRRYTEFLEVWRGADRDRPELVAARRFLGITSPR